MEDLTPYIEADKYDLGKFHRLFIDELYWWEGERFKSRPGGNKLIALGGTPFGIEFALRKDVLQQKGIPLPDENWTLDDLESIARELTNPSAGVYGLGMTLYQHRAVDMTCMLAKGISGDPRWTWLTPDCKPNVDTPEFREACEIIKNWLDEGILNPGSLELASGMDWTLYGKEVVMIDIGWIGGAPGVPEALLPKTLFLTPPMGPRGRCGGFGQHALAIPTNAPHKQEAWEFIKWYNSLDIQYELAKLQVIPSLIALLESPTLLERQPWIEPIVTQALAGVEQLPKIEIALEIANLIIGTECDNYWAGRKSLDAAIKDMVDGMTRSLRDAGFI